MSIKSIILRAQSASLFIAAIVLFTSCSKQLTSQTIETPKPTLKVLSAADKERLLSNIEKDLTFLQYIDALTELESFQRSLVQKSKNYDPAKFNSLPKATTEADIVKNLQDSGFENPTQLIDKMKSISQQWIYVSKKFPDFTKSLTDDEKKAFFRKNIDNVLDKKNAK